MEKNHQRKQLEKQLINLLEKAQAHITFEEAIKDIPAEDYGKKVGNVPYTLWQLVNHLRIAQADILDFSRNPDYQERKWPDDYWPNERAPRDTSEWEKCIAAIIEDRNAFLRLLREAKDLNAPFPHGNGQNLLREALLIADHNAYHVGQIILLRRMLYNYTS